MTLTNVIAEKTNMKEEIKVCEHCGQKIRGRWESLSKGLVSDLVKLYSRVVQTQVNEVHLQNELDLTKNQYNNFQKLRYFGLAVKVKEKSGYWLLTRRGADFLTKSEKISKKVYVSNNQIQAYSEEKVGVIDLLKEYPIWLKREDYVNQIFEPKQTSLM